MVGAATAVLLQAPTKLREDQHQHPIQFARLLQIAHKRADRHVELLEQVGVRDALSPVSVETAECV